jgi:hypothetical protein
MAALVGKAQLTFALSMAAVVGCGSSGQSHDGAVPELAAIEAVEAVRIGGPDASAAAFMRPRRLILDGLGEVFIFDDGTAEASVFTYEGVHARTFGGKGPGPGEFRAMTDAGFKGDTLWIFDWSRSQTTFLDRSGSFVRTSTDMLLIGRERFRSTRPMMYASTGEILYSPPSTRNGVADSATAPIVVVNASGRQDTVTFVEINRSSIVIPELGGGSLDFPAGASARDYPLVVVQPRGGRFAVVQRRVSDDGQSRQLHVRIHAGDGRVVAEGDFPDMYKLVTADPVAAKEAAHRSTTAVLENVFRQLPDLAARTRRGAAELVEANMPFLAHLPVVDKAIFSGDGLLWLRITPGTETRARWLVLDDGTVPLGLVTLPTEFDLQDHVDGRAWGFEYGEMDVPYVVGMDIAWPPNSLLNYPPHDGAAGRGWVD